MKKKLGGGSWVGGEGEFILGVHKYKRDLEFIIHLEIAQVLSNTIFTALNRRMD